MTIKKEAVYTIKEAHDILGIHPKKLNRIAVKYKLQKIDNRYLFTGEFLLDYIKLNDVQKSLEVSKDVQQENEASKQLDLELEALKSENESLKERIKELEDEQIYIADNERLEVFTNEDYQLFEQRLMQWQMQRNELEHKDKMLELTQKSKEEQITFLSNQLEYQRTLANKQLEQLETIFEILQGQNRTLHQLNFINAKDKGYDKK